MIDEHIDRLCVVVVLLEDEERLLVQPVLDRNVQGPSFLDVVVLQLVGVANDLALVCADGRAHHEALQAAVVGPLNGAGSRMIISRISMSSSGRSAVRNALTVIETSSGVSALGERGGHNLVNELTTVDVIRAQDLDAEVGLTAVSEVLCLLLEHSILIHDVDELRIA